MIEKLLVDEFEILENDGQYGLSFVFDNEPIDTAEFLYDGRNCGILIRNGKKALIFTNIVDDLRPKLLAAPELMIIEMKRKGEEEDDIAQSYMCDVTKVDEIPVDDTLPDALYDMLEEIHDVYGDEGVKAITEKVWKIQ